MNQRFRFPFRKAKKFPFSLGKQGAPGNAGLPGSLWATRGRSLHPQTQKLLLPSGKPETALFSVKNHCFPFPFPSGEPEPACAAGTAAAPSSLGTPQIPSAPRDTRSFPAPPAPSGGAGDSLGPGTPSGRGPAASPALPPLSPGPRSARSRRFEPTRGAWRRDVTHGERAPGTSPSAPPPAGLNPAP